MGAGICFIRDAALLGSNLPLYGINFATDFKISTVPWHKVYKHSRIPDTKNWMILASRISKPIAYMSGGDRPAS